MTHPWETVELTLTAATTPAAPYTDVDVRVTFTGPDGADLRRPAFWDGGSTWRVRFAAPYAGTWAWRSVASVADEGLGGVTGTVEVVPGGTSRGLLRMADGGRTVEYADGTPFLVVADTAWALPWRATEDEVRRYAADRAGKGFTAVLLMSVQPDMRAVGPADRSADEGFAVAFADLPAGRLTRLDPAYFQDLDRLLAVLHEHGLVPVLQPVFQGFGWKGLDVAGTVVPPADYARYCRYLVARYGASPTIWLPGADGWGDEPQTAAGGAEIEAWDAYRQPTGIHYNPAATNAEHQAADWLDFQWCQTGHRGDHVPERVADMWRNRPVTGVANGEPSYEHTRSETVAHGWWQGHEAWSNLCAGGTMGVAYGAANLWQWKHHDAEPGHEAYFLAPSGGWREALDFPGSAYVGLVGRILDGLSLAALEPDHTTFLTPRGLRGPGVRVVYLADGGPLQPMRDDDVPPAYRVVDPRTGAEVSRGEWQQGVTLDLPEGAPLVLLFGA